MIATVEVACHLDGLYYSNNKFDTGNIVVRKCMTDIFMVYLCFGKVDMKVYFVSPKVYQSVNDEVTKRIEFANELLKEIGFEDIEIEPIFNEKFSNKINSKLKELVDKKQIKSTEESEDYLRSLMILNC